jgi:hypothetical protein
MVHTAQSIKAENLSDDIHIYSFASMRYISLCALCTAWCRQQVAKGDRKAFIHLSCACLIVLLKQKKQVFE